MCNFNYPPTFQQGCPNCNYCPCCGQLKHSFGNTTWTGNTTGDNPNGYSRPQDLSNKD